MLTLVLGGTRSGKSEIAERLAARSGRPVVYLATGQARDAEMVERIARHQARRDPSWRTVEEPLDLAAAVRGYLYPGDCLLLDSLGTWASNLLLAEAEGMPEERALMVIDELLTVLAAGDYNAILVSDEVGLGVVPPTPLGRAFRDLLGQVNQRIATRADRALLVVAGLPVDLKALEAGL